MHEVRDLVEVGLGWRWGAWEWKQWNGTEWNEMERNEMEWNGCFKGFDLFRVEGTGWVVGLVS